MTNNSDTFTYGTIMLIRKFCIKNVALVLTAGVTGACSIAQPEPQRQYTAAQQRMVAKFGSIGYELDVDAMKGEEFKGVNFYEVTLPRALYGSATQSFSNKSSLAMSGPIPEQVRIVWRKSSKGGSNPNDYDDYVAEIVGDEVIDVGTRIPQEIIGDLSRDPRGTLRLKFRMSKQGTLLGWDIERRPGYDPNMRDKDGDAIYVGPVHSMAGGDFREAEIFKGKVTRAGWYIDKRIGSKIDTDN